MRYKRAGNYEIQIMRLSFTGRFELLWIKSLPGLVLLSANDDL